MTFTIRKLAALASLACMLVLSPALYAQTSGDTGGMSDADREKLKQEIVKEVMDQLRGSDVMEQAVQKGIQDYILKQQDARAEAQKQQQAQADQRAAKVRPVSADRDHIYGNPDAEVSLIEYSDFECPYCKRFHPITKELVDNSGGKVNLVYRHFPLSFHNPGATREAEASECAADLGGNKGFWGYADAIYKRTKSNGNGFPADQLVPLAGELGMDADKFKDCLDNGRQADRVKQDLSEGITIGINGTPGNIILNNKTGKALARPGVQPLDALEEAVKTVTAGDDGKDNGQS
jgi:protein-disulfide isomerase